METAVAAAGVAVGRLTFPDSCAVDEVKGRIVPTRPPQTCVVLDACDHMQVPTLHRRR
jgi:hypothetical protein